MIATLILPPALRVQIETEARGAFPRECCGLMEGVPEGDAVRAIALHPARNLAADDDRFEIDPADHFRAVHAARANGRHIVGCYHSHPNGTAQLSERDQQGATQDGFVWLVCTVSGKDARIAAFVPENGRFHALELREIPPA